jgi:hypothetical protein
MSQALSQFTWKAIDLSEVVYVNGIPHVTRAAIGEWLEYADPQKAIDNILDRNPHLKSRGTPLSLRGMGGARDYETTVFHPIGFLLIVMESGQPKAHAMKEAVAEFVWQFAGPRTLGEKARMDLLKWRSSLILNLTKTRDAFARQAFLADLQEVSLSLGLPVPRLDLLGKDAEQLALEV